MPASRPRQVVHDVQPALTRAAHAVGVAVEGADAADVDVRRVGVGGDAVLDAAGGEQHAGLVHERRPDHRHELGGVGVGVLVETGADLARDEPAVQRRLAVVVVVEAERQSLVGRQLRVVAGGHGVGTERRRVRADAVGGDAEQGGVGRRDGRDHWQVLRPALVAQEIERAVAHQRPADGAAVVVALELGLRRGRRQQERPFGQPVLPREEVGRAVEGVAAQSGEGVLQPARDPAELGREVGHGLELLHGVLADDQIARPALQVVRDAVDVHLPQAEPAVDGRRGAGAGSAARDRRRVHAGLEHEEIEDAAADGGDGAHHPFVVGVALHGAPHFHHRLFGGDVHGFRERRGRHRELHGEHLPGAKGEPGLAHRGEGRRLRDDHVLTGRHQRHGVAAGGVADDGALVAGAGVERADAGRGHRGVVGLGAHHSFDDAVDGLALGRGRHR